MELFTAEDFKIFDLADFNERMAAIALRIRPKLASIGEEIAPKVSRIVDCPLFVHVAKHARRTVNPPDDTWAALGGNPRGYKADVHFKVAVSRRCVRFLFEAGPEYYAKKDWVRAWRSEYNAFLPGLKPLSWFRNEHDDQPVLALRDAAAVDVKKVGDDLTRTKHGHFVLGRRIDAREFAGLKPRQVEKLALETFGPVAPLFHMVRARKELG